MSGSISGVTVSDGEGITIGGGGSSSLILRRMDAKIKFTFLTGTRPDENGQVIQSFEPKGWRVFNIPKTAFMMERNEDACSVDPNTPTGDYSQYASLFFDSEWANFEEFPDQNTSSFSFYMLENRQTPKNSSFTNYQDRSRQKKTATGLNEVQAVEYTSLSGKTSTKSMRIFQNANDFSTYVLVSAKVIMKLTGSEAGQTLGGDVLYLIHLGDWTSTIHNGSSEHWNDDEYSNVADFQTRRNTSYNYTVTVNSVNNIRIEVETSDGENIENQPGASGQITIAKEEIAICDAHYEAKTMTFSAKNFFEGTTATADDLTWRVSTPFGEGSPSIGHDGEDIPAGLDYKWVHFRLNKKDANNEYYQDKRRRYTNRAFAESSTLRTADQNMESDGSGPGLGGYHNDGVMDIIDMVKYIKTQVKRYASWLENGGNYADYKCDFDSDQLDKAKICVTVFVDEYYYDKDPIFGGSSPTLWKRFVNKEERAMHILCNSNTSKDLESRATGSVITIQQKPIKSIYNTDESYTRLQNAWGLESVDEHADKVFTYNQNKDDKNGSGKNNDEFNGLANSIFEWGLAPNGTTVSNITTIEKNIRWDKYLSFEVENELPQLRDGYESLRYICMSRNRDNNGNGVIDRDEIRWYLASVRQLIGMYVGDGVLESSVRIYNRSTADRNSDDPARWRQHVISSTKYPSGSEPTVIWGEEGISTGNISGSLQWGNITNFTIRCVRNLGMANDAPINEKPDDYIQYSKNADGSYTFECTHINESALRYYSSRELDYEDERATANCLYKKFETAPADQSWTSGAVLFKTLNDEVSKYGSSVYAGYCPDGYRLPSQTELAVMRYYMNLTGKYPSRTFWSFGVEALGGSGKDGGNKYGFCISDKNISLDAAATFSTARCVRDVRVE